MAVPDFSMRQLLEAGVHFGHQAHRWNPKMGDFIFGTRNNIHVIDLAQTVPMLHRALQAVSDTVAKGGRILFVGTKRQAQDAIAEAAKRSAQYYVNSRWLGGTLTNWKTISGSIARLRKLDELLGSAEPGGYTKKERLTMQRERDKLDRSLGGIKDMGGVPDLLFVIDTNKEDIAIKEAQRLMEQRHGLGEVDDVDVVAGAEDERRHLGVPAVALVAEVDAGFEELTHIECRQCHARVLPIFRLFLRAPEKAPPVVQDHG
jgi:ribosomal protein S2